METLLLHLLDLRLLVRGGLLDHGQSVLALPHLAAQLPLRGLGLLQPLHQVVAVLLLLGDPLVLEVDLPLQRGLGVLQLADLVQ